MRVDLLNLSFVLLTLSLAAWGGSLSTGRGLKLEDRAPTLESTLLVETLADGTRVLRDAAGKPVPLVRYERILSGTIIADRVLADLCDPRRIVAFTEYGASGSRDAHRFRGKPSVSARAPIESVLALHPDLLIVNNVVDPGYVERLREHGVRVFDLGHMRGLDTLLPNIRAIGLLIGEPERAERYARNLAQRMARIAHSLPAGERPKALYLSVYADRLYGGAGRTSYHDVIEHAGLVDVAAEAGFEGWPELSPEQVLSLDPEVLLTKRGMAAVVCRHAGLSALRPCTGEGRVVELDGPLLDDPGPIMLDAAEALFDAYWGVRE